MLLRSLLAQPRSVPSSSLSSSSTAPWAYITKRNKISVAPAVVWPKRSGPRTYSERKTFKVHEYTRLFEASKSSPLIFLEHTDFSVSRLAQLRRDITAAAAKHVTPPPSLATLTPAPVTEPPALPRFTVVSTNFFGVALRNYAPLDGETIKAIAEMQTAGLAVLSFPDFNPPQLDAVLKAMSRSVPPRKQKTPKELEQEAKDAVDSYVPGRRLKRQRPEPTPGLKVVGALIEGRVFKAEEVSDVAKLPTLETLRAQLVGLLSAPSSQLAALLNEAGGAKLARTLEGLKKSLEEGQSPAAPTA
ncbi:hypothetical protein BC835DRAFT_1379209 [Cytidiella melzeri]|nr:hypothetical protein BC835DRAFT_1379209 [Cytidiella melzeri]